MDDVGNVRLVDAHAEGVRGDHDGAAVADEILLILPSLVRAESGVVARGGETAALQQLADLLDALARGTVDDAALVPAFFEQLEQLSARRMAGVGRDVEHVGGFQPLEQAEQLLPECMIQHGP